MRSVFLVIITFVSLSAQAGTEKFNCVIEDLRSTDIASETLYLELGRLYAPVFGGDLAMGTGAVRVSRQIGSHMIFDGVRNLDQISISLSLFGSANALKQWRYTESMRAEGAGTAQLREGFCTSFVVQ